MGWIELYTAQQARKIRGLLSHNAPVDHGVNTPFEQKLYDLETARLNRKQAKKAARRARRARRKA